MPIDDQHLRRQRDRAAVLKLQLANLRTEDGCALVFVLEGRDDLKIYDVWIRRIDPQLQWEPLVANGKPVLLEFRKMLSRDTTGLSICTYFIVDHDYDELLGEPRGVEIYVLDAHSVENLLTHEEVVASLLRTEFLLVGDADTRKRVVGLYREAQNQYAALMRAGCEMLHATKREACGAVRIAENPLRGIAVGTDRVTLVDAAELARLVETEQELSPEHLEEAARFFDAKPEAKWIRGKFMMPFFREWILQLLADLKSANPRHFPTAKANASLSGEWNALGSLAAKSPLPDGLSDFVTRARDECRAAC